MTTGERVHINPGHFQGPPVPAAAYDSDRRAAPSRLPPWLVTSQDALACFPRDATWRGRREARPAGRWRRS